MWMGGRVSLSFYIFRCMSVIGGKYSLYTLEKHFFDMESHYVTQLASKLQSSYLSIPRSWDYSCEPPCPAHSTHFNLHIEILTDFYVCG
jgi:hypothetical protein